MIRTSIAIECDSCGARQYGRVPTSRRPADVVRRVRRHLFGLGWRSAGGTDTCPRCEAS